MHTFAYFIQCLARKSRISCRHNTSRPHNELTAAGSRISLPVTYGSV